MQSYHIARNGQSVGVFTEAEIQSGLGSSQFFPNDLYWGEGMAEWLPVSSKFSVPAALAAAAAPSPYLSAPVNPYSAPPSQLAPGKAQAPGIAEGKLATVGSRMAAACLDSLVAFVAMIPMVAGLVMMGQMDFDRMATEGTIDEFPTGAILSFAVSMLLLLGLTVYNIVLLSTRGQTLGKMWMHIRIVSFPDGEKPGFAKAVLVRTLVNGLIGQFVPFYAIVDLCFIFREDRRCLHDLIAETTVVGGDPPA